MAKRYNRWPHEVLELTPFEFGLAIQCREQADADTDHLLRRANMDGEPVFPVVDIRG